MKYIYIVFLCVALSAKCIGQKLSIDSNELKYLANRLMDESTTLGVFEIPDIETPFRTMQGGYLPELDEAYLQVAIDKNILKLNTLSTIKGTCDSMIFMRMPVPEAEGVDEMLFYSFPGTTWLLLLQPCIITSASGTIAQGWLKTLPKAFVDYKFVNEKSAFDLFAASHGAYSMSWNKEYSKPTQLLSANQAFISDLTKICAWINKWMKKEGAERDAALQTMTLELVSQEGKVVAQYIGK
jgi:hypothetical protein